jgi:hypothetical protein
MRKFTILAGSSLLLIGSAAAAQDVQGPTDTGAPIEAAPAGEGLGAGDPATDSALPEADAGLPDTGGAPEPTAPGADTATPGAGAGATSDTEVMAEAQAFTDAEIQSFAAAALEIQNLQTSGTATQEQAASIVASSGLDAQTFNAIGQAMQNDPEVAERVQLAAAELQGSAAEPQG